MEQNSNYSTTVAEEWKREGDYSIACLLSSSVLLTECLEQAGLSWVQLSVSMMFLAHFDVLTVIYNCTEPQ